MTRWRRYELGQEESPFEKKINKLFHQRAIEQLEPIRKWLISEYEKHKETLLDVRENS